MNFTKSVCHAFFNLDSKLAGGEDIIKGIYYCVEQIQNKNISRFKAFDARLYRKSVHFNTSKEFLSLFHTGIKLITNVTRKEKEKICLIFHVADVVEAYSRKRLSKPEYQIFLNELEKEVYKIISGIKYYDEDDWRVLAIRPDIRNKDAFSQTTDVVLSVFVVLLSFKLAKNILEF